jgi:hypothetical protein
MNGDKEQEMGAESASRIDRIADEDRGGEEGPKPGSAGGSPCSAEDQRVREAIGAGDYRTATALSARRYGAALGRLCMAMLGSQSEADDLVQETLLVAHHSWAAYRGAPPLRPPPGTTHAARGTAPPGPRCGAPTAHG